MTKAVVYSGTRNVYYKMMPAVKSLLKNTNVDQVFFLIEDDIFPYNLPQKVKCINVKNQQWFKKETCVNWDAGYGEYMVLLRAVYPQLFPQLDVILSLDNDTIVNSDISNLWDIDISNYYIAGVRDTPAFNRNGLYVNAGVLLYNLKKLREDKMDEKMIRALNTIKRDFHEQDLFNEMYKGHILELPTEYNSHPLFVNFDPKKRKIYHYAGFHDYFFTEPLVRFYNNMKLEDL